MANDQSEEDRPRLICDETSRGKMIAFTSADGLARALLQPLAFEVAGEGRGVGLWGSVICESSTLHAQGHLDHNAGVIHFTLEGDNLQAEGPVRLKWRVSFEGGPFTGAVVHSVTLPGVTGDPALLDLPSIHYGNNSYGKGLFPHPDPRKGFAFRADRLAQPAIHYGTPHAAWSYMAANEAPGMPSPELLYSLGINPLDDSLELFFRYPQQEYGHKGDGGPEAYVAKGTFAEGEEMTLTWQDGDVLEKTLYLWCRPPAAVHDNGGAARFLWQLAYPNNATHYSSSLWWQAGQHIHWYNVRLFNPDVGGGQYESPEGSGTAMLGFVEQSLRMASTSLVYANFAEGLSHPPLSREELTRIKRRAAASLTRWAVNGRTPEGLVYTACDRDGYFFGYRDYSDYENLTIVRDDAFDTIRLATEMRGLLSAAMSMGFSEEGPGDESRLWVNTAIGVAEWLAQHPLPTGGYSSRYTRVGEPLDPYPAATGAVISLFVAVAGIMWGTDSREGHTYIQEAIAAYERTLAPLVRASLFAGGTLDASCPDREAAIAALDACLQLYLSTNDEQYLSDAQRAADNILSYTLVYPISTFGRGTDAVRNSISTFGACIVSPENQHLDPVSSAPGFLLYGLFAGDAVYIQAGIESLKWTLDGRWAIKEAAGLKQSEQLLHTRWYYNTFFSQRGDFRLGMPLWGLTDSEHGWPQVIPSSAWLGCGNALLDFASGRAVAVDGWRLMSMDKAPDGTTSVRLSPADPKPPEWAGSLLLRVLRLPPISEVTLEVNGRSTTLKRQQLEHGYMLEMQGRDDVMLVIRAPFGPES